jgi:sodium-dependent dicarboxylate transporter 2/3/5
MSVVTSQVNPLVARTGLVAGPLLALSIQTGPLWGWIMPPPPPTGSSEQLHAMAAVAALMAVWWLTEAVPMAVTALMPLVLFPMLGIMKAKEVAPNYGAPIIFLFLGGFLIALAVEESGLHRRVALWTVSVMGDRPAQTIFGFMLGTALLSMWISNTATVMLMLPIALSVLSQADELGADELGGDADRRRRFSVALLLGIAYAASIGGMGTLIGTPPNLAFKTIYDGLFSSQTSPALPEISFFRWMLMAMPLSLLFLVLAWFFLTRFIYPVGRSSLLGGRDVIGQQLRGLGRMSPAEKRTGLVFLVTGTLWVFREPMKGFGWSPWLGLEKGYVDDGTVAILMAVMCFIIPSGAKSGEALLQWNVTRRVPWGILILFGGGLALAGGMQQTGLDVHLGRQLAAVLGWLPNWGQMAVTALGVTSLTELTSNLASVNMISPVLARTAGQLDVPPLMLMLPATLAASCAFMLPVATPPNAIVYGSGRLRIFDMIKAGLWLNLIGVVLVVLAVALFGVWAFGRAAIFGET